MFRLITDWILAQEGGVADVGDGKGITRWGQTPGWLSFWNLPTPTSVEEARTNYELWLKKSGLSALCEPVDALALSIVDYAVHSGERAAIRALQSILGVKADGILGPITKKAVQECDRVKTATLLNGERLAFLAGLAKSDPRFLRGWVLRISRLLSLA